MRLIDKDALLSDIERTIGESGCVNHEGEIMDCIRYAPEVGAAPVVRGEWLVTDAYPHRVYCSLCYKTNVPNEEWLFEKNEYPAFCMWCGAKMEDKPCGT